MMNQRGFMLLSAVFLTLIVSFMSTLTLQAVTYSHKNSTADELTAINLADEQFAMIESLAAQDNLKQSSYDFLGDKDDLLERFKVETAVVGDDNLREVKIKVTWENPKPVEFIRIVRIISDE